MIRFPAIATFVFLGSMCNLTVTGADEPVAPPQFVYDFAEGSTNVYSVQIESQGESGREVVAGNFLISSRSLPGNLCELSFRGQLRRKALPGMAAPGFYYRPGGPISLAQYFARPLMGPMTLVMDEQGQVLRQSGDVPLPVPLGELMVSLIVELPSAAVEDSERSRSVAVLDAPLLLGPASSFLNVNAPYMGYPPGRAREGVLQAIQKRSFHVASVDAESVTLETKVNLDSLMTIGDEPRVSATGEGEAVLDRKTGMPRQVQMECKTLAVTGNFSQRSVVSIHWKLLEGEEREIALRPPTPSQSAKTKPLDAEGLAKLTEQLKSSEESVRVKAARELSAEEGRIESPSAQFLNLMASLAEDRNTSVRETALAVLADHANEEQVDVLIEALPIADQSLRSRIVKALGRIGDKRAAKPLAELIAMGPQDQFSFSASRNRDATEALVQLGPEAERAVLQLLKQKSLLTQYQACGILKDIGTRKSIRPLQDLALSPSREVSDAAAEALRSINARESK